MLWFAVSRSIDASEGPPPLPEPAADVLQGFRRLASSLDDDMSGDLADTLAAMRVLLGRLGEMATTLQGIAALKLRLDGGS